VTQSVLVCDVSGTPRAWADEQTGACYFARKKVVWSLGQHIKTFLGGHNDQAEQSRIDVVSILGVTGPIFEKEWYERETIYAERMILYARDRHMCAYCGQVYGVRSLTIDHVHPRSKGGKNTWVNTVTACKPCNVKKADRTPEEASMLLLYVPYAPTVHEKMVLKNRNILGDQMDFLMVRVPQHSRLWLDYKKPN
jgi:hypothetical protein